MQLPPRGSSSALAQPLQIHPCAAGPALGPWRCLKLYQVKGKHQESACEVCFSP